MQEYFLPDALTLTCPTCTQADDYLKGSNETFGLGIFVKAMLILTALCPRGHQFSVPIESVMDQISTS